MSLGWKSQVAVPWTWSSQYTVFGLHLCFLLKLSSINIQKFHIKKNTDFELVLKKTLESLWTLGPFVCVWHQPDRAELRWLPHRKRCSAVCHSPRPPSRVTSKPLSLCDLPVLIWMCQPLYWTFVSLVHKPPWGKNVKSPSEWGDLKGGSKLRFQNILLLPVLWNC